ncbi:SDR family NAD(P)-dependent oxidoreductase [Nocardia sp. NPDC005998]|uniref:SDR family NAD(P)-dependent oxidoreductase n=1 Tax=Nocardia sp. NPDC005998 TaxID=3156894 RepID=UPI0033A4931E
MLIKPRRLPAPWVPSLADRVAGRTVLITGASSGIGRALADAFAVVGATTLVVARRADELEVPVREIGARGGVTHAIAGDLSTDKGIDTVADRVFAEFCAPETLVDNAGRSISAAAKGIRPDDPSRTSECGGNLNGTGVARADRRGTSMPADVRADRDNARIE